MENTIDEQNQRKLEQISTLSGLIKCSYTFDDDEDGGDGSIKQSCLALPELGWEENDLKKIQNKILSLIDQLQ